MPESNPVVSTGWFANINHPVATFVPEHSNGWFAMDSNHLSF
jgi:hypothetical protein